MDIGLDAGKGLVIFLVVEVGAKPGRQRKLLSRGSRRLAQAPEQVAAFAGVAIVSAGAVDRPARVDLRAWRVDPPEYIADPDTRVRVEVRSRTKSISSIEENFAWATSQG